MSTGVKEGDGQILSHDARKAVRPVRPRELQDRLNRLLYHPLAWRLALLLSHTRITPNAVSMAGAFLVLLAAMVYIQPLWPFMALAGLLLHMTWHVVDGADGDLARLTGRDGPGGELVDGICDYVSHFLLYFILAFHLYHALGAIAWFCATAAGLSRVVQANQYEAQRRQYQWWAYGVPWLRQSHGSTDSSAIGSVYLALAARMAPDMGRIDAIFDKVADDPIACDRIRAIIRENAARLLPRSPLLGANYRTIALGVSMLAGTPLYFFLYEAVVLNLVLGWSAWHARVGRRRVTALIDQVIDANSLR